MLKILSIHEIRIVLVLDDEWRIDRDWEFPGGKHFFSGILEIFKKLTIFLRSYKKHKNMENIASFAKVSGTSNVTFLCPEDLDNENVSWAWENDVLTSFPRRVFDFHALWDFHHENEDFF